jgi:hypothetical protein
MPDFAGDVNASGEISPTRRPREHRALSGISAQSSEADARLYAHYESVLDRLADEEDSALRQREECYALADAYLADAVASARYALRIRRMQDRLRTRLVAAGRYYCTCVQVDRLLTALAEVGADIERYCAYMGVASIAEMPAHLYCDAMAAIESRRGRA